MRAAWALLCAERSLRRTLEGEFGVELAAKKPLIRAEVGAYLTGMPGLGRHAAGGLHPEQCTVCCAPLGMPSESLACGLGGWSFPCMQAEAVEAPLLSA